MNKTQTKVLGLILVIGGVIIYFQNINSTKERIYRLNTECAKQASQFAKEKNGNSLIVWDTLQTMFNEEKNSCFAEFNSGGGITLIYDLTHNKELALLPANAGELYPDIPGGEMSTVRIEYIKKYTEIKKDIFKNEK